MQPTDLMEHPEGGRFKRVFCSNVRVTHEEKGERPAMSHIYFSLNAGEVSKMHRVTSDEAWNLYRGEGFNLYLWDGTGNDVECVEVSPAANRFCYIVPAGTWQAAVPLSSDILVGCSVAPAFDFADFTLLADEPELKKVFLEGNSELDFLANS